MSSGDDYTTIWLPNSVMRERATVTKTRDLGDLDGFIIAKWEEEGPDGRRRNALTNRRDFQRILDGYACPDCLAKFKSRRDNCCVCPWERDMSRDIIDQVPDYWKPGPSRTSQEILRDAP